MKSNFKKNKFLNFLQSAFFSSIFYYSISISFSNQKEKIPYELYFQNFYKPKIEVVRNYFDYDKSGSIDSPDELKDLSRVIGVNEKDLFVKQNLNYYFYLAYNSLSKQGKLKNRNTDNENKN